MRFFVSGADRCGRHGQVVQTTPAQQPAPGAILLVRSIYIYIYPLSFPVVFCSADFSFIFFLSCFASFDMFSRTTLSRVFFFPPSACVSKTFCVDDVQKREATAASAAAAAACQVLVYFHEESTNDGVSLTPFTDTYTML